jgi:glycosyltransferase involved in cell wall biosynthesis
VITPSNYSGLRLQQEYGVHKTRIAVIPSGIPIPKQAVTAEEAAQVRKTYGIAAEAPLLLYSGRMAKEKNLHMLLDSCEQVVFKSRPDAFLLLAGAGMEAASLQHHIDSSSILKGRVVMTGFLPRPQLDPIYAAADLYTFPSVTETQGMVLGEAMAAGTPCVAVDAGGAPETVSPGEDGLRTPNDPVAFGEAIVSLINDSERLKSMGKAAIANAELRTPEKMGEKVLAVYAAALTARLPMEDYDD